MIQYQGYKKQEPGDSKWLKLTQLIPNAGDNVRFKCLGGKIEPGYKGKPQLTIKVLWNDPSINKDEEKELQVDSPSEKNEMKGSQVYRGMVDNNIQDGDVFFIEHGGKMDNDYNTTIYNVSKDAMAPAPQAPPQATQAPVATQEEQVKVLAGEPTVEPVQDAPMPDEDVRIEDIPF